MESKDVKFSARGRWGGILGALAPQLQPGGDAVLPSGEGQHDRAAAEVLDVCAECV